VESAKLVFEGTEVSATTAASVVAVGTVEPDVDMYVVLDAGVPEIAVARAVIVTVLLAVVEKTPSAVSRNVETVTVPTVGVNTLIRPCLIVPDVRPGIVNVVLSVESVPSIPVPTVSIVEPETTTRVPSASVPF